MFAMKERPKQNRDLTVPHHKQSGDVKVAHRPMTKPALFLQRSFGNSYLQSMARDRQTFGNALNTGLVMQFQTDPTRPKEMMEEPGSEESEEFVEAAGASEEIEDTGEGVGSIEAGSPAWGPGTPEEQEESSKLSPVQTKLDNQFVSRHDMVSPSTILNKLDSGFPIDGPLRTKVRAVQC
jgi:hypothetical protein